MTAPDKIWAAGGHYWENPTFKRDKTEYTRSDLIPNAAYVEALRAIADLVDISGGEFAKKHPKLNAELDAAGSDRWGEVLAQFALSALSARPDAPDVRAVTVAQLEYWAEITQSGMVDSEIRAIIGEVK